MIPTLSPWKERRARHHLHAGGVVLAYPTEAVYGLGCDPLNPLAVARLLRMKQRSPDKGLILIAATPDQLESFIEWPDATTRERVLATWPGPVTWLLPVSSGVPQWLHGCHQTLAVRVTAHPAAAALCRSFGAPLVSTSANPERRRPAVTALKSRCYFPQPELMIIHGAVGGERNTTAIYDAVSGCRVR